MTGTHWLLLALLLIAAGLLGYLVLWLTGEIE